MGPSFSREIPTLLFLGLRDDEQELLNIVASSRLSVLKLYLYLIKSYKGCTCAGALIIAADH
jgi:hypothetical protein